MKCVDETHKKYDCPEGLVTHTLALGGQEARDTYCPVCDVCSECDFTMSPVKDDRAQPVADLVRHRRVVLLPSEEPREPFRGSMSDFEALYQDIRDWSNPTFGDEQARGPIGPLKHLVKEVCVELLGLSPGCWHAVERELERGTSLARHELDGGQRLSRPDEWADLLILVLDGHRRAMCSAPAPEYSALREPQQLARRMLGDAFEKMSRNRARVYPKPEPGSEEVSEHVKPGNVIWPIIEHVCHCGERVQLTGASMNERSYEGTIPEHETGPNAKSTERRKCSWSNMLVSTNYPAGEHGSRFVGFVDAGNPTWPEEAVVHLVTRMDMPGGQETYTCACGQGLVRMDGPGRLPDDVWENVRRGYFEEHGEPRK